MNKQEQEAIDNLVKAIQEVENAGLIPLVVIENQGFEGDEFDETGYESVIRVTTENINFVEKEYVPF